MVRRAPARAYTTSFLLALPQPVATGRHQESSGYTGKHSQLRRAACRRRVARPTTRDIAQVLALEPSGLRSSYGFHRMSPLVSAMK
jgi:hypothetical protein